MVGVVVSAEYEQTLVPDLSRDEVQHLERRAVGPLQVLEDDEQRTLRRQPRKELGKGPQQPRFELARIAARRERAALSGDSTLERREELRALSRSATREQREHGRLHGAQQRQERVGEDGVRDACLDGISARSRARTDTRR